MKEVIPLCFGQCGINIGSEFIQQIYKEQGLNNSSSNSFSTIITGGEENIRGEASVYFSESSNKLNTFTSRSLFIDLANEFEHQSWKDDQSQIDLSGNVIIPKQKDAFCNPTWPGGRYESDTDLFANDVEERVRKLVEECDSFNGFQIFHGMVGSSSGFCSRIMTCLREEYADKVFWSCSVFHDSKDSDKAVWMYDSILSFQYMKELTDMVTCIKNSELIEKLPDNKQPTNKNLNNLIRNYFPNITSAFRYPGPHGCDLRKMCVTLSPFGSSLTEVTEALEVGNEKPLAQTIYDMNNQVLQTKSSSKILSAMSILRVNGISTLEVERIMRNSAKDLTPLDFPYKSVVVNQPLSENTVSNTLLTNSSAICPTLQTLYDVTETMFKRKVYMYGYCRDGFEEMEITEAQYYLKESIDIYTEAFQDQPEEEID